MHLLIFALSALVLAALTGFLSWKDALKQPLPPDPAPSLRRTPVPCLPSRRLWRPFSPSWTTPS